MSVLCQKPPMTSHLKAKVKVLMMSCMFCTVCPPSHTFLISFLTFVFFVNSAPATMAAHFFSDLLGTLPLQGSALTVSSAWNTYQSGIVCFLTAFWSLVKGRVLNQFFHDHSNKLQFLLPPSSTGISHSLSLVFFCRLWYHLTLHVFFSSIWWQRNNYVYCTGKESSC